MVTPALQTLRVAEMNFTVLQAISSRRLELINGGNGIKNPLLSPDEHVQSPFVEEFNGKQFLSLV